MEGPAFDELAIDIEERGLDEPILLYEGKILDGRNRYRACEKVGRVPRYETFEGTRKEALARGLASNLKRRHLDESQRAMVAAELANLPYGTNRYTRDIDASIEAPISQSEAAEMLNVSRGSVQRAAAILKDGVPELAKAVKQGKVAVGLAAGVAKLPKKRQKQFSDNVTAGEKPASVRREIKHQMDNEKIAAVAPPTGKYRTIVIDPPWDFSDEGDVSQMGRGRPDYAAMPIDKVRELPIPELAHDDCHLYLWITNRSLPKGFALLEAWGFRYITMLTWCKPSIGLGNYYRINTEHLLFGVKGTMRLARLDAGTWFQAERGKEHSEKPAEAYELIASCSPEPRIDMFARQKREGFTSWENLQTRCLPMSSALPGKPSGRKE